MNREEILALPAGRDLDALVAEKVMGIPALSQREWQGQLLWIGRGDNDRTYTIAVPNYSESIAAAWLVVEKFVPHIRIECHEESELAQDRSRGEWHVDIWVEGRAVCCASANVAPLAICRAALLAVS